MLLFTEAVVSLSALFFVAKYLFSYDDKELNVLKEDQNKNTCTYKDYEIAEKVC